MTTTHATRTRRRRKPFPFFLALSCLIHASLILLLAFLFARHLAREEAPPPPPEVTLVIPPPSPNDRPVVEAREVTDKAPTNAPFQSDQNSKAASEQTPDGNLPMPSQQGIPLPGLELRNQHYTPGDKPASQVGNPSQPTTQPSADSPKNPADQKSAPSPSPTSSPSPTPSPSTTPSPEASPTPPVLNKPKLLDSPNATANQIQRPSTTGSQGAAKGYQPETRQNVIRGNISNRGRSSVAAEATPIGRYKKAVADAIGSRWYYYVKDREGLLSIGTVGLSFKVTSSGKVAGLHVIRSNGHASLESCSIQSIMDAKLPPIPPDIAATLQNGCLEVEYNFTIY